jgi:hypothetical protein
MRAKGLVLVSSLLALRTLDGQISPAARQSTLLGTWEAITRSAGGLGATISFEPENALRYTLGAMVDMKYRRSRDSLYIMDPQGTVSPFQVSFVRDTLVMVNEGKQQRETRVGAPTAGADLLIGRWTYLHYTGVPAFEEFTPTGDFHLRVPIRTLEGNYAAVGDSAMLHLPGPGGGDRAVRFAFAGDTLVLTFNGQSSRYVRAAPLGR